MTTLESKTYIGDQSYSVEECLNNMRGAFGGLEAVKWGFLIKTAFVKLGYNHDIDKVMNEILASKDVPPIVAKAEERSGGDEGMPPVLINKIFRTEFNKEQLMHLWRWIKEYLIDNIRHPYQYLSLLLFLEYHHSTFLQESHISNADMEDQMRSWYPNVKIKCSADSLGSYRNGFFSKADFSYISWVNSNGEPPLSYEYKRDQTISGFQALVKLCSDLDLNMSEIKMK